MITQEFTDRLNGLHERLVSAVSPNTRTYEWRIQQLGALQRLLVENETDFNAALWKDLHKPPFECAATEQGLVLAEISHALRHLRSWMRPQRSWAPLYNQPGRCEVRYDSRGLVLIIGAWNYPVQLLFAPLVAAIAAGNSAVLKPSEITKYTAALIAKLVPRYLDVESFCVIEGGPEETGALLDKKFDYIFFTGSGKVGQIVMTKAAVHLTPVALELGGKSPAVVLDDADLKVTARRIAWGKFMNAGQTCVAPDYVIVEPKVKNVFLAELASAIRSLYGEDPRRSPDYCRIVNATNFDRLRALMQGTRVLSGGDEVRDELYIAPTVVEADWSSPLMHTEIFGPILPVLTANDATEMIDAINQRPHPLALYVFTRNPARAEEFLQRTTSGGSCVNDVVIHMPVSTIPFGGVGASGMGNYHGEFGFRTMSHEKAVLKKTFWFDLSIRYAPYTDSKIKWFHRLF
jgi:aldehyde dehydrogenase (NAD+)